MDTFLTFLDQRLAAIKETERRALELLHTNDDEPGYRDAMRTKAELLAGLSNAARPYLDDLPLEVRPMIEHRLDMFSQSAQRSLDIGSVFYMSALLYNDDHQPGEPNTLEVWYADLKRGQ